MTEQGSNDVTRRDVLKQTATAAAASALAGVAIPAVHAAGDETVQIALVGCGGRGTGAAHNALSARGGPTKLVAMADVFSDRLNSSHRNLKDAKGSQVDVPDDRKFIGFDGYKKAIDSLKPGDVAIFATPPAFRWVHFGYAIQKGVNVFMEKPVTVDGPTTKKMFKLAEEATKKGLKVGVGLMCRHCEAREQLIEQFKKGEIGDIILMRAYRMAGLTGSAHCGPKPKNMSELEYQIRNFHGFLWASGGAVSDFLIHNIDECCWMKEAWPVEAKGSGARMYRGNHVDQNFDTYSIEYTFGDGTKLLVEGRTMPGAYSEFASYAHGSKNSAIISTSGHSPARCRIYKGQKIGSRQNLMWSALRNEPDPYQREWDHLMEAIRLGKPYNEAKRGAEASLVTSMGRMACHTGKVITYDQMLNCEHEFAPDVDKLTKDSPAPVQADKNGKYPIPQPGIKIDREY
ncbi:MAG: Gfo/Idh/MocA family oxidoreductase [Gemmataceae bacterium]